MVALAAGAGAQPAQIDIDSVGPQVGVSVPEFSGVDQFNRTQTLASVAGPEGTMLVFFRSADW
ncbi:MAG TPA: hypothetical protein VMO26_25185 [Vicinamibacterales bacterium]|nr:hypothetical protein [Vicinamibacterales bacterium]